eukprot:1229597-Heterocapsa_arctica.AAC.1
MVRRLGVLVDAAQPIVEGVRIDAFRAALALHDPLLKGGVHGGGGGGGARRREGGLGGEC